MARRKTFTNKTNSETLVNEWLRATNKKSYTNSQVRTKCAEYWNKKGITRLGKTYERAARRLRESNYVAANMSGMRGTEVVFKVTERPQKRNFIQVSHAYNGVRWPRW